MGESRIIFQEWIVNMGIDPQGRGWYSTAGPVCYNQSIVTAVTRALDELDPDESEFIRRYYMQGMGCDEIVGTYRRNLDRLTALHLRAVRKLRARLAALLGGRFNVPSHSSAPCPLCAHPSRLAIETMIRLKPPHEPWTALLRYVRQHFGLSVSPQRLIGHKRYHMMEVF
jgi:hypothetical protein